MEFTEILQELASEAIKQHKLEMCGTYAYATSPVTGARSSIKMDCHDYRICVPCNKLYISKYFSQLRDETPVYTTVKEGDWKAMRKRLKRRGIEYLQWPQNNGLRFVLLSEGETGKEPVLPDDFFKPLSAGEWEEGCGDEVRLGQVLRRVPYKRRPGGKLGRSEPAVTRSGDAIRVEFVVHNKQSVDQEAWDAAVEKTQHLDPHDATEAEAACDERTSAYKEELQARGATILRTMWQTRYVRSDAVRWNTTATKWTREIPLTRYSFLTGRPKQPQRAENLRLGF